MDSEKRFLIENTLFKAISAFHDLDDNEKIDKFAKDYFVEFCKENNIDLFEAYVILEELFVKRRESTIFKYEHYQNGALRRILLAEDISEVKKDSVKKYPSER